MTECIFCQIVAGEIPADLVLETEEVIAFRDIEPKAPTHILVIPREHFSNLNSLVNKSPQTALSVFQAAVDVAALEGLEAGYRVVSNTGADGGQTVHHVHIHVMGGRSLSWPPG